MRNINKSNKNLFIPAPMNNLNNKNNFLVA